ncbi:ABC transporter substrate-binding protein [Nocardioides marmoribigeumensis]|uniref:Peptide/nickel transport system substrate-binding protein n=1 Tax=Nocardioides marmoribigeumensis TaxID=433649 RepID=A0ABU2BV70_9ACTN|nr:ABC transporter substrate-binding protein [Nocardioides marmoribigeumensis]MDR7362523.1 peptide/nickel transport system substrate-binding protein [Nocardioides marmoribigeumensis]
MNQSHPFGATGPNLTRRGLLQTFTASGLLVVGGSLLTACSDDKTAPGGGGKGKAGGRLRVGVAGGSAKDTIDAHLGGTTDPDVARGIQLFEPLAMRDKDFHLEMLLAQSIEPHQGRADAWEIRIRDGVTFHDGKTMDLDDVIFSLKRIVDPENPGTGASSLSGIDMSGLKKLDDRTLLVPLTAPDSGFPDQIGQYFNTIVPVGYDPKRPVGTGPFKFKSFTPGEQSVFVKNENYWQSGLPYLDELVIIDFADDTARVNALRGGQVDAISNLPPSQVSSIESGGRARALVAETGGWQPLLMRVDQQPFQDVRVRQAFKLIADREQLVQQALAGQGQVGNDIYGRYDEAYDSGLPQRQQDLDQAKFLLKQAGASGAQVELTTAPFHSGVVEAAQIFAEQAKGAGVDVRVRKVNEATYWGPNYLKWTFSQDFWFTRTFLAQVAQGNLPNAPYNQTHWKDPRWVQMYDKARTELDESRRTDVIHDMQKLHHEEGGELIWSFANQIDAVAANVSGIEPAKSGIPLMSYGLKHARVA